MKFNSLYYGDNLLWLKDKSHFPTSFVDLIYLDPPFNSKTDYNILFTEPGGNEQSQAQVKAFDDTWHWDSEASDASYNELLSTRPDIASLIHWLSQQGKGYNSLAAYLSMMATRLIELHRVLKPTGSIYLHCDWHASSYLRLLMDKIFGQHNFRNEIVWKRTHFPKSSQYDNRKFSVLNDTILFYSKTNDYKFYSQRISKPLNNQQLKAKYNKHDSRGSYRIGSILRGASMGKRPNLCYEYNDFVPSIYGWRISKDKLFKIDEDGDLGWTDKGTPFRKHRPNTDKGHPVSNIWDDIKRCSPKESLGYPTQKPQTLLERIISSSSDVGDIVLDPFCGCGTTVAAAQELDRRWIGLDVTWLAINTIEHRLTSRYGDNMKTKYAVYGSPEDLSSARDLFKRSPKEFEIWAITKVPAHPREYDRGVDGICGFTEKDGAIKTIVVQVKGGAMLNPGMVRDLIGTVKNEGAAIGLMITLNKPTRRMKELAIHSEPYKSELWEREYPSIQILTVEELFNGNEFDLPTTLTPFKKSIRIRERVETIKLL
ncbi:hypothetical protein LCGC14_1384460 [marine sediment metagenome]|uniref:DNA methylase N-4/N-6 domain-containing protein n=1 Tax=marine sediment metagenome TaxID=412755 RepID=A0A0F9MH65_9ZZZZ